MLVHKLKFYTKYMPILASNEFRGKDQLLYHRESDNNS